ncbi:MAG: ABC transporter substrate-binding protein [Janthinobacterium lividum]
MFRRNLLAAGAASLAIPSIAHAQGARVLRVIPQANLTSLDPVWTTAVVTRNHAYLVYDQLVAMDSKYVPRPAMAEGWTEAADGLEWVFTLRPGQVFHDNEPVRAQDCVASIRRWMARDSLGQSLALLTTALDALDDRRFRFRLSKPFPLLLAALAKPSPMPCFIFPERLASTDPYKQVTDPTGSGPYRFVRDEWNPGSRAVWAKFPGYRPAAGPVDGIAGARLPNLDRIEWTVISDSATAAAAMASGEQDYWEYPLHDLLPLLKRSKDVVVGQRLSEGTYAGMRINHLHPPFDNPATRRAVLLGIDQRDYLRAVVGDDTSLWSACESVYACGTPYGSEAGNASLRTHDVARARAALAASGYAGQKTVLLAPSDYPGINALSLVTADLLTKMGFNLDLVSTDWGTVTQRRASLEPVERGGWSVFHSTWSGADVVNPAIHQNLRANGRGAWFGWPTDPAIEAMRTDWIDAADDQTRKRLADAIQVQALQSVPFVPLGYYWQPSAWRRNLTGMFPCPITAYWNIGKA